MRIAPPPGIAPPRLGRGIAALRMLRVAFLGVAVAVDLAAIVSPGDDATAQVNALEYQPLPDTRVGVRGAGVFTAHECVHLAEGEYGDFPPLAFCLLLLHGSSYQQQRYRTRTVRRHPREGDPERKAAAGKRNLIAADIREVSKVGVSPIRVGIVGAGANTRERHIPELRSIPGVEIVSVANRSRTSAERVAAEFGIPKIYECWEDLVQAEDADAIVIGTWPYLHCDVTLATLSAGKHVLCEARMARDLSEARRMLAAAHAHPALVAQLVPAPMTFGVDKTIARLIREGFLGELLAVEVRANGSSFLNRDAPLHWRQNRALSGNNILSMGIWYETILRWIGGASRVYAQGKAFVSERTDLETGQRVPISVPDHIDILAVMHAGVQAHFQFSAVTGLASEPSAWLYGSEGALQFRLEEDALYGGRRGATSLERIPIPAEEKADWRVEREFVGAIRHEEPVRLTTFEDGVRYMEFTEAVRLSLDTGQAISLPLP
jgi:predicted dehydrogenase